MSEQIPTPRPESPGIQGTGRQPRYKPKTKDVLDYGYLVDAVISFPTDPNVLRDRNKELPDFFYRTGFEESATLSCFVGKENHKTHPDVPHLKLHEGNAFQNMGEFVPAKDLNPFRIFRQTRPKRTKYPSGYVSVCNSLASAEDLARHRCYKARLRGNRLYIAAISSTGFIPAKLSGSLQLSKSHWIENTLEMTKTVMKTIDAEIDVWVENSAVPSDGSAITLDKYHESGASMLLSIVEVKKSNIGFECNPKHDGEWLFCGPIKQAQVAAVLPFDGSTTHRDDGTRPGKLVTSKRSTVPYKWDWDVQRWVLDPSQASQKRKQGNATNQNAEQSDSTDQDDSDDTPGPPSKRQKTTANPSQESA